MLMLEKPEEGYACAGGNVSVTEEIWTPSFCFVNSFIVNSFQQTAKLAKGDKKDAYALSQTRHVMPSRQSAFNNLLLLENKIPLYQ